MKLKKTICVVCAFILIASAFCACNKEEAKPTETKTTVTIGAEAYTTENPESPNKDVVAHMSSDDQIIKNDYYDENGKIKCYDEYIYDETGTYIGTKYFDAEKKLVARYMQNENKFYDESGKEIDENAFTAKLKAIGAIE